MTSNKSLESSMVQKEQKNMIVLLVELIPEVQPHLLTTSVAIGCKEDCT